MVRFHLEGASSSGGRGPRVGVAWVGALVFAAALSGCLPSLPDRACFGPDGCEADQRCSAGQCVPRTEVVDDAGEDDAGILRGKDADTARDAEASPDASSHDAGPDAEVEDAGRARDAGEPDSGEAVDAGEPDSGEAVDAGVPDAGVPDAGVPDAGVPDAGVPDSGVPDSGVPPDSGLPPTFTLIVTVNGAGITVNSNPPGIDSCGSGGGEACSEVYTSGAPVALTATGGLVAPVWGDACLGELTRTCTVVISANTVVSISL